MAMPTNFLRRATGAAREGRKLPPGQGTVGQLRVAVLKAGRRSVRLELLETRTADLIWSMLPLYSIAETWGESLHFDTPIKAGRERTARLNVTPGDVCLWTEDERVVLAWGETPISGRNGVRLMRPCNVWARTIDEPSLLKTVTPGEKVSLVREC